ncbi:hypothetical protein [Mycolicibacterium sp. lyk4-40-TYG-92]|uniref:hypothetical protein n=1 Tax=Mycolicibacterium sp. lyk4-40-TYG-92 TaxID=3040295 RepID=UPI00254A3D6A|nr:hypothetical protein [Mycolicibacterium sp. lyk4-40-TYG-92]
MPTELSDGFYVEGQIPAALIREVFAATFIQNLPGMYANVDGGRQLTLWFNRQQIDVTLLPKPAPIFNPIEVSIPFLARLSGQYNEVEGAIHVRTAITQDTVQSGGRSYISVIVDFRPNSINSFTVSGLDETLEPIWGPVIIAAVKPKLAILNHFAAGPLFPKNPNARFYLSTYPDAEYGGYLGFTPAHRGVLAVFLWQGVGDPPQLPNAITPRQLEPDTAVALVPRDRVQAAISASMEANGLTHLPKTVNGTKITSLAPVAWHDYGVGAGHFYISGTAKRGLGTVSFEAWVKLFVEHGETKVIVVRTKQNGDFWVDIADTFSAGAITRMLEDAIPSAISGVGVGAFGQLGVFATEAVSGMEFAAMDVTGSVDIWPGGLGIPAHLAARPVTSTFPAPTYLLGLDSSREFHTDSCKLGRLIKRPRRFPTWMRAVELGFNGCWYCQSSYNVVAMGNLKVEISNAEFAQVISVTARLISNVQRFGVTVRPLPERLKGDGWRESTSTWLHSASQLVPGTWEVTISHGDWTVTVPAEVGKAWWSEGTTHGTSTVVYATLGSPETRFETVPY